MSMLFVHFQNLHFEKWANIPRKRDIFLSLYRKLRKIIPSLCMLGRTVVPAALPFDKKLHKPITLCNLFIKEKEIFCKKGRIASKSFLKDVKY
jgi:hypothetical protein